MVLGVQIFETHKGIGQNRYGMVLSDHQSAHMFVKIAWPVNVRP